MSAVSVGDQVRHKDNNWSGPVIDVNETEGLITVRPMHPRPKLYAEGGTVTAENWKGWKPITVTMAEMERV